MRFQEKVHCDQRVRGGDQRGYNDDLHIGFQQGTYLVHGGDVPKSIVVVVVVSVVGSVVLGELNNRLFLNLT